MKINARLRKQLNQIALKYSRWIEAKEICRFYDEVSELGITIPCWSYWDRYNAHPYLLNDEPVDNSRFVLQKYESDEHPGRVEYNLYFS